MEALAAAARAQGATADSAILVSIASSLKSFVLGTQVQELQGTDDPEWRARKAAASSVLHARYLAAKNGRSSRASASCSSEEVAAHNVAEHSFDASMAELQLNPGRARTI